MADNDDLASASDTEKTARRRNGRGTAELSLEDQVAQLQTDLQSITATLTKLGAEKIDEARFAATSRAQSAVDQVQDEFGAIEKQLKDTIREKPLTAVA